MNPHLVHALADVQAIAIGAGSRVWQFVIALPVILFLPVRQCRAKHLQFRHENLTGS